MRTTITLDDDLIERAMQLTDIREKPALIRMALTELVERESARRLALLGGSDPNAKASPRWRSAAPKSIRDHSDE
jgi:Arc/MetJ family transcription regulator